MQIREIIQILANEWPSYLKLKTVHKNHKTYDLTVNVFPEVIAPHLEGFDFLKLEGSTGKGQITASPWIAVFDRRITAKATEGFYVVYLYSVDLSTVTLSLAFGTTQFETQFGKRQALSKMRDAAMRLQSLFETILPSDLSRGPIALGASRKHKMHFPYQQSAILSFPPYVMTDPSNGMKSFQKQLRRGGIAIRAAKTDPNLFIHVDAPNGPPEVRYTYVRLKGKTVTAIAMFVLQRPEDGKPYFTVGYAVPKRFQKQGRAKEILVAAIADMQAGLARNGLPEFYIEAIVGADNLASRKVAEQIISNEPEAITEELSGLPAFKYVRRIAS